MNMVQKLKTNEQDFEWYPTTPEIIACVMKLIGDRDSVLDIGAGRGDVLLALSEKTKGSLYAIEKSDILIGALPSQVSIIGTDFHRQTLIDKKVNAIFCNPPYSEYEVWAERIIKEANADKVILVIPVRWKDSKKIQHAIKQRGAVVVSAGMFSFENAERAARCTVDVVSIRLRDRFDGKAKSDPFSLWFDEYFPQPEVDPESEEHSESKHQQIKNEVAKGRNLIEVLEELYLAELRKLIDTFRAISMVDPILLQSLGVSRSGVGNALQLKIAGLKNLYWKELFYNMTKITDRLSSKSRRDMLVKLFAHNTLDFTAENAYAVVIWAVKNANKYHDDQLVDVFRRLSDVANMRKYVSNERFENNNWRFNRYDKEERTHYKLDYRIVHDCYCFDSFDVKWHPNGLYRLTERARDIIQDICTAAKCLGIEALSDGIDKNWRPGEAREFYSTKPKRVWRVGDKTCLGVIGEVFDHGSYHQYRVEGDDQYYHEDFIPNRELFMEVKAHKANTLHFKLDKQFMMRLNVEVARILKWVHTPKEAAETMGYPIKDVQAIYNTSFRIESRNVGLLPEKT